nr:hypothetical protein [uncultured Tolumonas sp.]
MKRILPIMLIGLTSFLGANTYAAEPAQDHQIHHPDEQKTDVKTQASLQKADVKLTEMSALQEKMANAKSPKEKNALMAEQMKLMQECMSMMSSMSKDSKGMMMNKPEDMMLRQQMMEKRMDMMQMMMQMMMDQTTTSKK